MKVRGASSCDRVSVIAHDGGDQYPLEASGSSDTDGGVACEFQGLTGHPGTFTLSVLVDNQPVVSKTVTLEKIDECNVAGQLLSVDIGTP